VFFGKERPAELRGVFSSAAVLWSSLPSECSRNQLLNCGYIDTQLSKPLLRLFEIEDLQSQVHRLNISVYSQNDGHGRGMARIFAEAEGVKVTFLITSAGGEETSARRLTLQRDFSDGTADTIRVKDAKKDGFILEALEELVDLHRKGLKGVNKDLLCGSCPAKIDGLPGSIV